MLPVTFPATGAAAEPAPGGPRAVQAEQSPIGDVAMEIVGQIGGPVTAVAVRDGLAFVGIGPRLVAVDVSDPARPATIGQSEVLPAIVSDVALSGDLAFVAAGESGGLRVMDVADPRQPREVGWLDTPGSASAVAVVDRHVVIADGAAGYLRVVDAGDPARPREVAAYQARRGQGSASQVFASGHTVFVAEASATAVYGFNQTRFAFGSGNLEIVDLSQPSRPSRAGWLGAGDRAVFAVAEAGGTAYVGMTSGRSMIQLVDVSNPARALPRSDVPLETSPYRVSLADTHTVLALVDAATGARLQVVDATNPDAPLPRGAVDLPGEPLDLAAAGGYGFVAAGGAGLIIVDVRRPGAPAIAGSLPTIGATRDLAVVSDRIHVTDLAALHRVDVSDPTMPRIDGSFATRAPVEGLAADGNHAFTSAPEFGLDVLAVTGAGRLGRRGGILPSQLMSHDARSLAAAGGYLFAATTNLSSRNGLSVRAFDTADPRSPRSLSAVTLRDCHGLYGDQPRDHGGDGAFAPGLAYDRGRVVVAAGGCGLRVVDASRLRHLVEVGSPTVISPTRQLSTYQVEVPAVDVATSESSERWIYAATDDAFRVIDGADPARLRSAGIVRIAGDPVNGLPFRVARNPRRLAVEGRFAYLADGRMGLRVIDVADPARPYVRATWDTPGDPVDVVVRDGVVYVADGSGGVLILRAVGR